MPTAIRNTLIFYGYRLFSRFAEVIPRRSIRIISVVIGFVGMQFAGRRRTVVARNLQRAMGKSPTSQDIHAAYGSYIRYWLDSFHLPSLTRQELRNLVIPEGEENLQKALAQGKGVILALPHLGNWDVGGAWLAVKGIPLVVVMERIEPPELFQWFRNFRQSYGIRVLANGPRIGPMLVAALKRNEVIALMCDRDVDDTGIDVEFFGETTKLPKGPAMLARRTGAALLPTVIYETNSGYRACMEKPVVVNSQADMKFEVTRVTQDLTYKMESLIKKAPHQWHVFQPNWPTDRFKL